MRQVLVLQTDASSTVYNFTLKKGLNKIQSDKFLAKISLFELF